jgi:phenylalanyl-tRNA synthetase alpha chain
MTSANNELDSIATAARETIAAADSLAALEQFKVEFFGKKGAITAQLKSLGALPPDRRRETGARINALRDELIVLAETRRAALERAATELRLSASRIDGVSSRAPCIR